MTDDYQQRVQERLDLELGRGQMIEEDQMHRCECPCTRCGDGGDHCRVNDCPVGLAEDVDVELDLDD